MKNRLQLFIAAIAVLSSACSEDTKTLFKSIPGNKTGIHFINSIDESDTFNILTHEYIYNGGGIGVADFNNDGFQDIFFAGNQVSNQLYLNRGDLEFEDISSVSGIQKIKRWCSGVSVVDINQDGWMDVYLSVTMNKNNEERRNILYLNQGLNENGIPLFEDKAREYGIDDDGFSVNAAFFDYDLDGDLDLYVLTNQRLQNVPTNYRPKMIDGSSPNTDRFYRNEGNNFFTNVSKEAGITIEGFGLGVSVSDFNSDGWPDLYISNDYLSNDLLYINQKNGSFVNQISKWIGHQSEFSMGNDVADINNDGLPDIITLDMLPETSYRKKTTIGNKSYQNYINNEQYNYEYQFVRNMLHLNNGLDQGIMFSEIGLLSGIHQTEWSWSPLFADFDNDGNKDLLITNGFPKDVTDKDFANFRASVGKIASTQYLLDSIPEIKIPNYAFRNNGDLTFTDVTKEWGVGIPSYSNGAAFADFDNDGDLDYVVNNIDQEAFFFENTLNVKASKTKSGNFLRIKLINSENENSIQGTKVFIYSNGIRQFQELAIYRGYLSSVENIIHFGLGNSERIDSVIVNWAGGTTTKKGSVETNQTITIDSKDSFKDQYQKSNYPKILSKIKTSSYGLNFLHPEEDKIDFNIQRTIPHKFSQNGPGIGVGDINNDGLEDFYIGGSSGYPGYFFTQRNGSFIMKTFNRSKSNMEEDQGVLFFDADNDSDLDLYLVSGSIEAGSDSTLYQDRIYINDGHGNFKNESDRLPPAFQSGSCVRAADFDKDGDLDLFVGSRVIPGAYPLSPKSYLLRNNNGRFIDATQEICPALSNAGLVTDAIWTDFDNDQLIDLVVVGEFSPVQFYKNKNGKLERLVTEIDSYTGWWNSIVSTDFDLDGDMDYVVGNLGLNNIYHATAEYPLKVFAKDFDNNGSIDPVLACYSKLDFNSDKLQLCPLHFWDELNSQSPKFRQQFNYYKQFGRATLNDLLSEKDLKGALVLEANYFSSSYIENLGNSRFKISALPIQAQVSSINGMVCDDFDNDGYSDILLVGNNYGNEVFVGRYDAFTGLVLTGNGKGGFKSLGSSQSGFYVEGDAKSLVKIYLKDKELFLATQNKDSVKAFQRTVPTNEFIFTPNLDDSWGEIFYPDKKQKVEFHYGSGYLSQSTRRIRVPANADYLMVYSTRGKSRKISFKK